MDILKMEERAKKLRSEILKTIYNAKSGHPGGSLSCLELLMTLYLHELKIDAKNPQWEERDRFIMSKGHATPGLYTVLAEAGFFPKDELEGFRGYGRLLQGHAYRDVPGVELSTGSLGMGLSVGIGMALAGRLKRADYNVYVMLGDGEIQEGNIWEAAMSGGHHKLPNLCAIVDYNKVQENGFVNDIKNMEPLDERWRSFRWNVVVIDGHNFKEILGALEEFKKEKDKPTVIIANTIKGKGVEFMEYDHKWHGKAPNLEQLEDAVANL
ncbi:transketolase [Propionigenium maris DSM 9537]|uniref:Transketolase n=1 Tax=Propionigenium maris DSM 9537 TaxID=1123000 RepID=A0A9W6GG29_9FUSO|nr:transketolase [Propionigenium maris]GLI54609.1 transketolase [Propionigenium maris DSM 9537]